MNHSAISIEPYQQACGISELREIHRCICSAANNQQTILINRADKDQHTNIHKHNIFGDPLTLRVLVNSFIITWWKLNLLMHQLTQNFSKTSNLTYSNTLLNYKCISTIGWKHMNVIHLKHVQNRHVNTILFNIQIC